MTKWETELLFKMASMLAEIAYEIHDRDFIDDELKDMLLEFWRTFEGLDRG